jgi:hypothetical protein
MKIDKRKIKLALLAVGAAVLIAVIWILTVSG